MRHILGLVYLNFVLESTLVEVVVVVVGGVELVIAAAVVGVTVIEVVGLLVVLVDEVVVELVVVGFKASSCDKYIRELCFDIFNDFFLRLSRNLCGINSSLIYGKIFFD